MKTRRKILFIAPLPPPVTGQSNASKVILSDLLLDHDIVLLDYSKSTLKQGVSSLFRFIDIARLLNNIRISIKDVDVIYLTLSQSFAGVVKDLVIFMICYSQLGKMAVHAHGYGIKKYVLDRNFVVRKLSGFFYKKMARLIVLGESLMDTFTYAADNDKVRVLRNYSEDSLFLNDSANQRKHMVDNSEVNVLFLSNLIDGKGYLELVKAFNVINKTTSRAIYLDFAGGFYSDEDKSIFLNEIQSVENIRYHGIVDGTEKVKLFKRAHIFCLPTYYKYEGQPISILEAYASGCAVITTKHHGIPDIFSDEKNGLYVQKKSVDSLVDKIKTLIDDDNLRFSMAKKNLVEYDRLYRKEIFIKKIRSILSDI